MLAAVIADVDPDDIGQHFLEALARRFDRVFLVDDQVVLPEGLDSPAQLEPLDSRPGDEADLVWFPRSDAWVDDLLDEMLREARETGHAAYANRLQTGYTPLITRDRKLGRSFVRHWDPVGYLAHRGKADPEADIYLSTTTFGRRPFYLRLDEPAGRQAIRDMIKQRAGQEVLRPAKHATTFQILNHRHMLRMLGRIETFTDLAGKRVLEIGASPTNPALGAYLAEEKGCHYTGLNIAEFKYPSKPRMRMVCEDIHKVDFKPDSFDIVFSIAVWEHIPDPLPVFGRIADWLAPGGVHYGIFQNWTSSIGHHIFAPRFPQHFVPDWAHLRFPDVESMMAELIRRGAPEEDARAIAEFSHTSPEINRVASRDFVRTMIDGPLEVLYLDGRTRGRIDPRAETLAGTAIPGRSAEELSCMGLEFALRKSDFDIRAWAREDG
ncbi:hypothetical protein A9320_27050 [Ruegeria sp. PBVC088]|nr:hypothetical protein A9320_27050 [Ruegeria sp. PBVC088]